MGRLESNHVPALDGVRGLAILLVIARHSVLAAARFAHQPGPLGGILCGVAQAGWCGVDLFFVLSGFLITGGLLDAKGSPHYFRNFYLRRTVRIFPLYYAALLVRLLPWPNLPAPPAGGVIAAFCYLTNFWQSFLSAGANPQDPLLGPTWSLAVEEQFYLLWPLLLWLLPRRALPWACLGLFPFAFLCRLALLGNLWAAYSLTPCRMDAFAAGALLAWCVREDRVPGARPQAGLACAAVVGLAAALCAGPPDCETAPMALWGYTCWAVLYAALVAACLRPGLLGAAFSWRPLRAAGKYSYAAYLLHGPALHALSPSIAGRLPDNRPLVTAVLFAVAVGVSFPLGWLSWNLYEKHWLKLKRYFPHRPLNEVPAFASQRGHSRQPIRALRSAG